MKKIIYAITFCIFLLFSGSAFCGQMKSGYLNDLQEQILEIEQKVQDGTASADEIKWLEYLKKKLERLEEE